MDWKKSPLRVSITCKGRGGKTVTVLRGLPQQDKKLLLELKKKLGVGGAFEECELVLQGDQRDRLIQWLRSQGAQDLK